MKMLHVCIRVKDLDASLKFYEEAIGLKETRRKDDPVNKFTLVYLSDRDGGYEMELTYNYDQEEPYTIGNGFSHTAVETENLEESRERHKEMGYEVTDLMGLADGSTRYYFVTDPDGYRVEVIEAK